jgi:hypothetical protein
MLEPVVIIDSSRVREGRLEDLRASMADLAHFAESQEPRTIAYGVYLNEESSIMTVLQVHPDSASAEFHMDVAAPIFSRLTGLVTLEGIDVYGRPSEGLLSRLRRKAEMLGGERVGVHDLHAGFVRHQLDDPSPG